MSTTPETAALETPAHTPVRSRLESLSNFKLALAVFLPLLIIYVATGNINTDTQSPDAAAAALPAWQFALHHTLHLDHVFTLNPWLLQAKGHIVSNRQPGIIFFAIPFYLLLDHSTLFNLFPGVVAAGVAAAGAVAFLTLALRQMFGTRFAVIGGLLVAFGTATWSVSADILWPHGPDQLFIAMAMFFLSRNRRLAAALAIALAVPIRAHLAVFSLAAGVWFAVRERSIRPVLSFGVPALVAIAGVVTYNHWVFGSWSLNGGYPNPTGALISEGSGRAIYPLNVLGALFSLDRGIVIWCPLAVILLVGIRPAWQQAPDWVRISAVAGILYFLVQMKLNFFSGGDRFWSYRLTIEPLTLGVPLLAIAARELLMKRPVVTRLGVAAAIYGVGTQAIGAIWFKADDYPYSPWWHSKLVQILRDGELGPRVVMAVTVAAMMMALAGFFQRRDPECRPSVDAERDDYQPSPTADLVSPATA